MKKLPKDAEASNILVGELNCLQNPISIFVRLNTALHLGDLTEVPVPTRFIFLLLGPPGTEGKLGTKYHEIGRSMATCFSDEVFTEVSYKAKSPKHIISGIGNGQLLSILFTRWRYKMQFLDATFCLLLLAVCLLL